MAVPSIHNHILFQRHGFGLNLNFQFPNYREDPNTCNTYGTTPLHVLSLTDCGNEIAEDLIKSGAQVNAVNHFGCTPLHFAVIHRNLWMVDILIEHGADVNIQDTNGNTALHFAVRNSRTLLYLPEYQTGDGYLIRKLLNNGANIDTMNKDCETPLMWAISEENLDIVKELLLFGANVSIRNIRVETCLHVAVRNGKLNSSILIELVKYGACVNCLDENGQTALDIILYSRNLDYEFICAKELIKVATLVNFDHDIGLRVGKDFTILAEFIPKCSKEVVRMKSIVYDERFSLCQFALGECNTNPSEDSIFDEALKTLLSCTFPIYFGYIVANFKRSYLSKKLININVYSKNKACDKRIYLNSDVISGISCFLSNRDLFNFIKAYSKSIKPLCDI